MTFDNVPVPVENVVGEIGGGFKVRLALLKIALCVFRMILILFDRLFLCFAIDCHEHFELGEIQYGQLFSWNDKETYW